MPIILSLKERWDYWNSEMLLAIRKGQEVLARQYHANLCEVEAAMAAEKSRGDA